MARFLRTREKARGQMPGSIIFQGEQRQEHVRINSILYNEKQLEQTELELQQFEYVSGSGAMHWINIEGLHDTSVIEKVGQMFKISPLALEDILNTDQRPRFFEDEHQIIVIMKSLVLDTETEQVSDDQVSFVLGSDYLISFQESSSNLFDDVIYRLKNSREKIRKSGPDYLLYALMDTIVDSYIINIEAYGRIIEDFEPKLMQPTADMIETIFKHKNEVAFFRKNIRPLKEVVNRMDKSDSVLVRKTTRQHYLPDLEDLTTQAIDAIEIYYTMVSDQLNIYNANVSSRANDVMKVLTIFAAIFIPLTFIVGVYGTNFEYIPELQMRYGYFGMWGIMIAMAGVMLYYFRKKGWL